MKGDLRVLLKEVEKKVGKKISITSDFEKLSKIFSKSHFNVNSGALKKVWGHVTGAEKPSKETLDKIALFVGFQSWTDFQLALHGESDAELNFEDEKDIQIVKKSEQDK